MQIEKIKIKSHLIQMILIFLLLEVYHLKMVPQQLQSLQQVLLVKLYSEIFKKNERLMIF